jgi:glycogen debranching enzyme
MGNLSRQLRWECVGREDSNAQFGIGVDPADGLLRQGAEGYQLTWIDAKVGDWVVTPRRGKAVEINALWFNALRLLEGWIREEKGDADARPIGALAEHARESFNRRFWNPQAGYLYDVVDGESGNDPSCRPNQVSLSHCASLCSMPTIGHPSLMSCSTNWSLLSDFGPWHRDHPNTSRAISETFAPEMPRTTRGRFGPGWSDRSWMPGSRCIQKIARARGFLQGFERHLGEACIGSISEVFDAEVPFAPSGCVAQAWSGRGASCLGQDSRLGVRLVSCNRRHDGRVVRRRGSC